MAIRKMGPRGAFTRVDLLVTSGAGLLLVLLLLPSLRDASEQEKVTQCLSNLHGLMRATNAYLADYDTNLPPLMRGSSVSTWGYVGQTNDPYWRWFASQVYIPATDRPINPYLLGAPVQPDEMNGSTVVARTPMPMVRCPSDRYSHQRSDFGPVRVSCYDDVGTSYQYNLHGLEGTNIDPWGPNSSGKNWAVINRAMAQDVLAQYSSVYTLYVEDPVDWGLANPDMGKPVGTLEIGNHGQLGKHSAGYLDGHGDYIYRDTRRWCGVGWAAIVPSWRTLGLNKPPIYYILNANTRKTCDP